MSVKQIPLSFPVSQSYDAHDFMPLACNMNALAWVERFPDWPYPAVIIYGEKGCGKTHLLHLWQDHVDGKGLVIDDAENIFGDAQAEKDLFHLFNQSKESGSFLFISMTHNISAQNITLPDLESRLRAAPQVEITAPDDGDIQAILVKLFHDRQLMVEPGVIQYIVPRIERSFSAVQNLVARIDESSLAEKRSVTVPLVRGVLA